MTVATGSLRAPLPPLWLGLALLIWGALTDNLAGAALMALMIEGLKHATIKWAMTARDFHRAADLTSAIFALVTAVEFSRYSVHAIYQILGVLPYCFLPLLLAQCASTAQSIPLSALFYSLRRQRDYQRRLDIAPHYIAVCLIAASTTAAHGVYFPWLALVLVLGLLVSARPQRYRWWQWSAAVVLALSLALATQLGMLRTQQWFEYAFMYWMNQFPWTLDNPNREVTAIGAIGRLKLSDQIRVRVQPDARLKLPLLLQEASYDAFKFGTWSARDADFTALDQRAEGAWDVTTAATGHNLDITVQHRAELVLLPAPRGTQHIVSAEIAELQRNRLGSLLAEAPPGALRFRATADQGVALEPPPVPSDRVVPEAYVPVLTTIGAEIGFAEPLPARARTEQIRRFFIDHFKYSLIQRDSYAWRTPLAHFLTVTRRGHCEYFATATVLLLRQAGIPARYAVGYVVENYSELERAYIARARHAHAWALAYVDGAWLTVDATPSVWYGLEDARASRWQGVQDVLAWLWFRYQRLSQAEFSEFGNLLLWLVPPLALVLYLRLRRSPTAVRHPRARPAAAANSEDSALQPLLTRLAARGLTPAAGETIARFLARAAPAVCAGISRQDLIAAYYRLRFAAGAPRPADARRLNQQVTAYCAALALDGER